MKYCLALLLSFFLYSNAFAQTFADEQLKYERVRQAKKDYDSPLQELFKSKELNYPPESIFIRAFKQDEQLELWGKDKADSKYTLIKTFDICASSGSLGPKRKEGDGQVPEGFYHINVFNPYSSFYLSMQVNYPNRSDKVLSDKTNPGGLIFIHGACVTIGCVPILDEGIKQLYWTCVQAKSNGQSKIQVHIFPTRLTETNIAFLKKVYAQHAALLGFWENLKEGFDYFETQKTLPTVLVDSKGKYLFK